MGNIFEAETEGKTKMIRGIVVRRVADIEVNDCKGGNEEEGCKVREKV